MNKQTAKSPLVFFVSLQRVVACVLLGPSLHRLDRLPHRPVLPPDQERVGRHGHDARAGGAHADGISGAVSGRVLDEEGKGGDDAAAVAEADDPGGADGAVGVAGAGQVEVHHVPAEDDGAGGKGAHGDEADGKVLHGEGAVDGEEDGEAGDDQHGAEEDEGEAEARVVGRERGDEAEGQGGGHGRHRVQLGLHGRVAKRFDDGGGEVGKGCPLQVSGLGGSFQKRGGVVIWKNRFPVPGIHLQYIGMTTATKLVNSAEL